MNFKDLILLTGAGFTANFGGFLGKEMWSKIFNNPILSGSNNLKAQLRKTFDFEEIYSMVLGNRIRNLSAWEYNAFAQALNEAYSEMDNAIKEPTWQSHDIHQADLNKFLDFFIKANSHESALCFTLNQDLFMERYFGWQPLVPQATKYFGSFGNIDIQDLNSENLKKLPTESQLDEFRKSPLESFCYIKLHGSQKWISSDGRDTKILGINKKEAIDRIPLLKWYFSILEQSLFRKNVKLVIIGYSFKDDHINSCIIKAIREFGLKLYVISTEDPADFSHRLSYKYPRGASLNEQDDEGMTLWNAIEGYFPYSLRRIFPLSQSVTAEKKEVFRSIGIPLIT
jgi:hypothetical protein